MRRLPALFILTLLLLLCLYACAEEEHEHVWGDYHVVTEPTCTTTGLEVRFCTVCNASQSETIHMTDHTYGEWEYYSNAQHAHYCTVCGQRELEKHDSKIARTITQATETRLGTKSLTCSACGYNYKRFCTVHDTLYSMESDYTLDDGTEYIKVDTNSIKQGAELALKLCSDLQFSVYASTALEIEVYANASSGEYRGILIKSGSAVLNVSGETGDIEFINLGTQADTELSFADRSTALALTRGENALDWVCVETLPNARYAVCTMRSEMNKDVLSGSVQLYLCPTGRLQIGANGISPVQGSLSDQAEWSFDTKTYSLRMTADTGAMTAYSAGRSLLDGRSSGTVNANDILWGWYLTWDSSDKGFSFVSPTYTDEGKLSGTACELSIDASALGALTQTEPDAPGTEENGEDNGNPATLENTEAPEPDATEKAPEPVVLMPGTVFTVTTSGKPTLSLHYENGICSVRVSAIPNNLTLTRIEFFQTFRYGGFSMLNAYTADASFTAKNVNGTVCVTAYFSDKNGKITTVRTEEFEYCAG